MRISDWSSDVCSSDLEDWKDFQFSYLGQNGLTEIRNANKARIEGAELELQWQASYNFLLSGGFAWYDAKLMADNCGFNDANGNRSAERRVGEGCDSTCRFRGSPYN